MTHNKLPILSKLVRKYGYRMAVKILSKIENPSSSSSSSSSLSSSSSSSYTLQKFSKSFHITSGDNDLYFLRNSNYIQAHDSVIDLSLEDRALFRFTNISIPKNATIISAKIKIAGSDYGVPLNLNIYANDTEDAYIPLNGEDANNLLTTLESIVWKIPGTWNNEAVRVSPDIKKIIQGIVNIPNWIVNNAISIIIANDDPIDEAVYFLTFEDWYDGGLKQPELYIEWLV